MQPFSQDLVKTDLRIAIPENHYRRIAGRSGLVLKGITTAADVNDSNFRGFVAVVLYNHTKIYYEINIGDSIGQIIFKKYETLKFVELEDSEDMPKT